jgi:PIN domain-containing protein
MAARYRKSKRRSAASSGSTPLSSPVVFFIDRSLGKKIIAERLREAGVIVEIHDDHFRQDALDQVWLTEIGKRGWIVLTKDDRIRYRPAELDAYRSNKLRVFIFGSGEIKAQEMADAVAKAMPKILRLVERTPAPFFARISRTGSVSLL